MGVLGDGAPHPCRTFCSAKWVRQGWGEGSSTVGSTDVRRAHARLITRRARAGYVGGSHRAGQPPHDHALSGSTRHSADARELEPSGATGSAPGTLGLTCSAAHLAMGATRARPPTPICGIRLLRERPHGRGTLCDRSVTPVRFARQDLSPFARLLADSAFRALPDAKRVFHHMRWISGDSSGRPLSGSLTPEFVLAESS